jgi:signal transduction histidine kinase
MRLRTELVVSTFLIISGLVGAILMIVRQTIHSEIDKQIHQSATASVRAFTNVQRQRELELSHTAALLADLPTLKALMTTQHAETIQDASSPFWALSGSDLFVMANPDGQVFGFHMKKAGWTAPIAERNLQESLKQGNQFSWWYAGDQLYQVFIYPILAGNGNNQVQLGFVALGYQVDSSVAEQLALASGSEIALTAGGNVIASTLSPTAEDALEQLIKQKPFGANGSAREIALGSGRYQGARVLIQNASPASVECYVLTSLQSVNSFNTALNRTILIIGLSAIVLAGLLLSFVSWTITRPLENLVAGVGALAAGNYTYSITPRGSSEVAHLGEAFSSMRSSLLDTQRRALAAEQTAALGRAAGSISHDLRHYLSALVANAEFLYEAGNLKVDRDEIYDEIKLASEHMTDLLDSLRELAKEETSISLIAASIEKTIHRAAEAVLAQPELRSRTIAISAMGKMDGVFDPKRIERVFFNLLLNACEAAPLTDGAVRVEIKSLEGRFEIRVADNGAGIPNSIRNTLFDPFVSSGKSNGTGLGLAIVRKIVHEHQGSVNVERTSESGTVILVTLPSTLPAAALTY